MGSIARARLHPLYSVNHVRGTLPLHRKTLDTLSRQSEDFRFPYFKYVFGLLVFALGVALFFLTPIGYDAVSKQLAARNWPQTTGVIIDFEVSTQVSESEDGDTTMYNANVVTEYAVDGVTYRLEEIYPGQSGEWTSSPRAIRDLRGKYDKGSAVTVWYEPGRPRIATLELGISFWSWFSAIVGGALSLLGLLAFLLAVRDTVRYVLQFFRRDN